MMDEESLEEFVRRLKDRHDKNPFPTFEYAVSSDDMGRLILIAENSLFDERQGQ